MLKQFRPALVLIALFTVLTGLIYPLAVTGIARLVFPDQAGGSLARRGDKVGRRELDAPGEPGLRVEPHRRGLPARVHKLERRKGRVQPHAPRRVSNPLSMPPHEGAHSMRLKIMPSVCAQSGSAVFKRWCGPAQMYMNTSAQK